MNGETLIDLYLQDGNPARPIPDVHIPAGSAAAFRMRRLVVDDETTVTVQATNADGTMLTAEAERDGEDFLATFPAANFAAYGVVENGFRVVLVRDGSTFQAAVGNLYIDAQTANAVPGDPEGHAITREELANLFDDLELADAATQKEVRVALQEIIQKLKGIAGAVAAIAVAVLPAFGDVTPSTVWEDMPPTSVVSHVVRSFAPPTSLAPATNYVDIKTGEIVSNTYTKAETDTRIVELAPPTSLAPATNYVDALKADLGNGTMAVHTAEIASAAGSADRATAAEIAESLDTGTENRTAATIFSQIDSKTSTNDVCAIVTNEVATEQFEAWEVSPSEYKLVWLGNNWQPYYQDGTEWMMSAAVSKGDQTSTELSWTYGIDAEADIHATRRRITRNALGLARLTDIAPTVSNTVTKAFVEDLGIESGIQEETDPVWTAAKGGYATTGTVAQVSEAVGTLWSYVYGDSVWIAVTNYMRTVGGVSPSFQLWEVREGVTNLVYWSKEEITNVTHDLIHDCKTNLEATVRNAVAEMPDKAWSKYQSATGNESPDGVTIVSTPTIQLTGGGEWYRYVDVASNSVWFLKSNGLHTFGGDTNGYFRILDDEGNATFEVRKTDSYLVDAVASSVHFDGDGNFCVSFESNIEPVIYTTASLESPNFLPQGDDPNVTVTWTQSGGTYTATLEQAVKGPSLFAYAKVEVQGETVIRNTVPTDLQGGIIVNGVKYNVGTATISGHTVLTLTPRN